MLSYAKNCRKEKLEEEARIEAERVKKQKEQEEENERIRIENEKIKQENEKIKAKLDEENKKNQELLRVQKEQEKIKKDQEEKEKQRIEQEKLNEIKKQRAPDKIKLQSLASDILNTKLPTLESDQANLILEEVKTLLKKVSVFIEKNTKKEYFKVSRIIRTS